MRRRFSLPQRPSTFMATNVVRIMESNMVQDGGIRSGRVLWGKFTDYCSPYTCRHLVGVENEDAETAIWKRCLRPLLFVTVFIGVAVILVFYLHPKADTVCYHRVGCFSAFGPWAERPTPVNFFPHSPFVINTTFIITSRQDPQGVHGIVRLPQLGHFGVINEAHIPWNQSSLIVFIIHGYTDDSTTWMRSLKDAFLAQAEDLIVVLVDWSDGGFGYYPQIVANTRVVAREISLFIRYIHRRFGKISPKRIHLVGHSLGAQISSYVGKSFVNSFKIYQITALDPAYPLFEGYSPAIRLHKSDARHVLAIHSNVGAWGLGMRNPVGTIDIYLNNGRDQRGCIRMGNIFKEKNGGLEEKEPEQMKVESDSLPKIIMSFSTLKDLLACSHRRAYEWLEDVLWDLTTNIFIYNSSHPAPTAPVIAYPVHWRNDTDILRLANKRAIHFSLCQEHNADKCWKLERNENDAFFRLPSLNLIKDLSSSFLIPTTDKSPFCVRYAYLEITTCPQSLPNSAFSGQSEIPSNTSVTLLQSTFTEEILIYQGLLLHNSTIKAWVEFPCDELQEPVHNFQGFPQSNQRNSNTGLQDSNKSYLSVKLLARLAKVSPETKLSSSTSSRTTSAFVTLPSPSLCMKKMKLSYYNETDKTIVRSRWIERKEEDEKLVIFSDQCVQIMFSSTETNVPI